MSWFSYRPYVSVAQRRADAAKEMSKLAKKGQVISPVRLTGKKIASTFWGKAWCEHLESYSDYANRLPRGRTYVRNGSVVDLQIKPGQVTAIVSGSSLYNVKINIDPLDHNTWDALKERCAGQIGSMIELLQGRLSEQVMTIITDRQQGLFPAPAQIKKTCSCPDWADMCKHVAAVLYGVGSRLDQQPQLLFTLRNVEHMELIAKATDMSAITAGSGRQQTVAAADLADVFGIEMDGGEVNAIAAAQSKATAKRSKPSSPNPAIVITTRTPTRATATARKAVLAKKKKVKVKVKVKAKAKVKMKKTSRKTAPAATAIEVRTSPTKKKARRKAKPLSEQVTVEEV